MTEQEQRIAIAEECGYQHMPNAVGLMWNVKENRAVLRMKMPYKAGEHTLPNYLYDLNAMHAAILTLPRRGLELFRHYQVSLANKRLGDAFEPTQDEWLEAIIHTEFWPEAFLRTVGKWKE